LRTLNLIPAMLEQLKAGELPTPPAPSQAGPTARSQSESRPPASESSPAAKKKEPVSAPPDAIARGEATESARHNNGAADPPAQLQASNWSDDRLEESWRELLAQFNDLTADSAGNFESVALEGNTLVVTLRRAYDAGICGRAEPRQRLQAALARAAGRPLRLEFRVVDAPESGTPAPAAMPSRRQRVRQAEQAEFVRNALMLFDGEILDVRPPADGA
jgi:hypothetical protein